MNKPTDLLPWILGGVSIFAVAAVITLVSVNKTKATSSPPALASLQPTPSAARAQPASEPAAPVALSTALQPASLPQPTPAPQPLPAPQGAAQPPVQGGQIWQCITNGVKTFSNNPCGDKSSLVAVREINTMSATPPVRYARSYPAQPAYSPQPSYSQQYADQNSSDQDSDSNGDSSYGGGSDAYLGGVTFVSKRPNDHPHRPHPHHNPGPPHNPGPAPRKN